MIKNRSFKFLLLPNVEQREYFAKCFGCVRFLYNKMLSDKIAYYKEFGEALRNTPAQYKAEFEWLREIDASAFCNAQLQLQKAYSNFFRDKNVGFPRYRSKKSGKFSYTTSNIANSVRIDGGNIRLPKIGLVKLRQHRIIPETYRIKSATISLSSSGKYFVAILTEYDWESPVVKLSEDRVLGLDYSSSHFYVDSQGIVADMPHFYRESEEKLAREQRKLSLMKCGSSNYQKQRKKVAECHERVANCRKDWLHKRSRELAENWDYICVEDINLRGMAGSLNFGKAVHDNGFGLFRTFLGYKLADRGKVLIKIDKWFPSSKMCSECGGVNSELTLKMREWDCECGAHHNRDLNAAINIKNAGLVMIN